MLTLNQEIEILKNFSLKHNQLNSFYFGDEWETDSSITPVYPLMEAVLQNTSLSNDLVTREYLIIISDLVNKDESNENHVLSDCEQICYDLIYYLKKISKDNLIPSFKVDSSANLTDFTERGDDEKAGFYFTIKLSTHIGNNSCNLPINSGNILDDSYIYVGGNYSQAGNFLVEIKDQNGNVIQTFSTSGEYMVTILTGIQQVIGNSSTTVIQDIID